MNRGIKILLAGIIFSVAAVSFQNCAPVTKDQISSSTPSDSLEETPTSGGPIPSDHLVFLPTAPCRLVDTRNGFGKSGPFGPPSFSAAETRWIPVAWSCGVPARAKAVSVILTAANRTTSGYLVAFPHGTPKPATSSLHFSVGTYSRSGPATVMLAPDNDGNGSISIAASSSIDVLVDVHGYYIHPDDLPAGTVGSAYRPISPCRISDTRTGMGYSGPFGPPKLLAGQEKVLPMVPSCGIPSGTTAVMANLTVTNTDGPGYLRAHATGTARPDTNLFQYESGQTIAGSSALKVSPEGEASFLAGVSGADLIVDVSGYFKDHLSSFSPKYYFVPVTPCRLVDTRGNGYSGSFGPPAMVGGSSRSFQVTGQCGIPANAKAVSLNFTAVNPGANGMITLARSGQNPPHTPAQLNNTSTLNYSSGDAFTSNSAVVDLPSDGAIEVGSSAATHLTVDIDGYYVP